MMARTPRYANFPRSPISRPWIGALLVLTLIHGKRQRSRRGGTMNQSRTKLGSRPTVNRVRLIGFPAFLACLVIFVFPQAAGSELNPGNVSAKGRLLGPGATDLDPGCGHGGAQAGDGPAGQCSLHLALLERRAQQR